MRWGLTISLLLAGASTALIAFLGATASLPQAGRANSLPPALARVPDHAAQFTPERRFLAPSDAAEAGAGGLFPSTTRSLLKVAATLKHGDYIWDDAGVPPGRVTVWIDLRRQMVSIFRNNHEIGTAVIIYGADDMESPEGRFTVLTKRRAYHSRTYDAAMPYSLFITRDGVALHASTMSARRATRGCIGLPEAFAKRLFQAAREGDVVEVTRSDAGIARRLAGRAKV